ncbi:MAG: hypothetical protein WAL95_04895 [Candidatus Acidiferrales bacterium]
MKVSDHLKKFHQHAAEHHDGLAKCYSKIASFGKAAKSQMKDGDGESLADCLEKIAEHHEAAAEFHRDAMAECSKIAGDDLNKNSSDLIKRLEHLESQVVPTRVSAVAPTVTAVPRYGQQPMQRPNVPIQFEKLVAIEE